MATERDISPADTAHSEDYDEKGGDSGRDGGSNGSEQGKPCSIASADDAAIAAHHVHPANEVIEEASLMRCCWRKCKMLLFLETVETISHPVDSTESLQAPHRLVVHGKEAHKVHWTLNSKTSIVSFQILHAIFGDDFPMLPAMFACLFKDRDVSSLCPFGTL